MWNFLRYVKLVELAMVHIIGSTKDERHFFMLAFMKSKFYNTTHLLWVVCMFAHWFYTLQNFSYVECIDRWKKTCHWHNTMGRQYALCNCWAYFCKDKNVLAYASNFAKFNDWFTSQMTFFLWCWHVLLNLHGSILLFCLCMTSWIVNVWWLKFICCLCILFKHAYSLHYVCRM